MLNQEEIKKGYILIHASNRCLDCNYLDCKKCLCKIFKIDFNTTIYNVTDPKNNFYRKRSPICERYTLKDSVVGKLTYILNDNNECKNPICLKIPVFIINEIDCHPFCPGINYNYIEEDNKTIRTCKLFNKDLILDFDYENAQRCSECLERFTNDPNMSFHILDFFPATMNLDRDEK